MLKDILDYIKIWEGFKTRIDPIQFRQKLREIRVKHIAHT